MMNTVVSEVHVWKDNSLVTESPGVNKSQATENEVKGELARLQCSVKVPVCDNLVDLNSYSDEAQQMKQDTIFLNPVLEGLLPQLMFLVPHHEFQSLMQYILKHVISALLYQEKFVIFLHPFYVILELL